MQKYFFCILITVPMDMQLQLQRRMRVSSIVFYIMDYPLGIIQRLPWLLFYTLIYR